jgi:hypothetical protein
MARLRIRIELNRGGVGVPLHKLASVVDQAQKFFCLLTEDIQIDQSKGEWLGFDFGNESLNFTAEFVGPVTAEQVAAFHAAFDGTTSLRRATIAQFARITEVIEQDELIGFGLYLNESGNEPSEWRCLSRRDALRITEEIQLLIEASGEAERESHLPAVSTTGAGARLFSDRRERGLESAKWAAYVREVETNMDRRISRVEQALEGQSGLIEDLHSKSASTEDSVRKLLTAVEGFCAQTTRQLESISPPAAAASPTTERQPEIAQAAAFHTASAEPVIVQPTIAETIWERDPGPVKSSPLPLPRTSISAVQSASNRQSHWPSRMKLPGMLKLDSRLAGGAALLVVGAVVIGAWTWQNLFSEPSVQRVAATSTPAASLPGPGAPQPAESPAPAVLPQPPATVQPAAAKTAAPASTVTGGHVALEASELTWVSIRDGAGNNILSRVFQKGDTHSLDVPNGAILRLGNAGGVSVLLNGKPIGPIGTHGQVRNVMFRNGSYKIGVPD